MSKFKKAEPVFDEHGDRLRVQGMAASSIASNRYDVSKCGNCHRYVVWAKSKAGKFYLADTAQYTTENGNPRFRAMPYAPHYKSCDQK